MTYAEKLKDPRWQKVRLEIFERDKFECQRCNETTKTLCLHHSEYKGNPWDCPKDKLMTLCEPCHDYIEGLKKTIREQLSNADNWEFYELFSVIMGGLCEENRIELAGTLHRIIQCPSILQFTDRLCSNLSEMYQIGYESRCIEQDYDECHKQKTA